ncbi:MAG: magnesium transporter [Clostridia bacterium]|nr:magnesium transporter [Clostridia bacterium]
MESKVFKYIERKRFKSVANLFYKSTVKNNLKILNILDDNDLIQVVRRLKKDYLANLLIHLPTEKRQLILESLNNNELNKLLEDVSVNVTIQIIEGSSQEVASRILKKEEIIYLLNKENYTILKPLVSIMSSEELVRILEQLKPQKRVELFLILPKDLSVKCFVGLSYQTKQVLLQSLTDDEIKSLMAELVVDETVTLIKEMPFKIVKRIMSQSNEETKEYINTILSYPNESVGRCMSNQYLSVSYKSTVKQALLFVKKSKIKAINFYNVYITDDSNKLLGMISIKKLLQSDSDENICNVMEKNIIFAHTSENKKLAASKILDYNLTSLPIVNETNHLVGVISIDDAVYIIRKRNDEFITKMNALKPISTPYLKTSIWKIWQNRIPWLLVLLISATFTGLILNSYESNLNSISPVLFACVPMIMDTGGNCGSQSSVTIIRAMSLNELTLKDWWKALLKEIGASFIVGVTLAIACFAKLLLIDNLLFGYTGYTIIRSMVVSIALLATVIIAKISGCLLPLIAKKCKLDPAVMAAPFITTIVDSLSLILFCSMSVAILA